jgi:hypothetical protein
MTSLERRFERKLETDLDKNDVAAREDEWAGESLARLAKLFEASGLSDAARDTGGKTDDARTAAEQHKQQVSRLTRLLNEPERLKRITQIAEKVFKTM